MLSQHLYQEFKLRHRERNVTAALSALTELESTIMDVTVNLQTRLQAFVEAKHMMSVPVQVVLVELVMVLVLLVIKVIVLILIVVLLLLVLVPLLLVLE